MQVVVHADRHETAVGAAARVAELMSEARSQFSIGLAGGTTPGSMYQELLGRGGDWATVNAWLSDERWVSHDDPRSNGRAAAEVLLEHVDATFHRPEWGPSQKPADSASHYETTLRTLHADRRPDLILLGVGADGHTASLFPGSEALKEQDRWFVANTIPESGEQRLTATYPLLWSARNVLVLAVGDEKAQAVKDSFDGRTPAARLVESEGEVEWYLDRSAASLLS